MVSKILKFVLKNVGSCQSHLGTSSKFNSTPNHPICQKMLVKSQNRLIGPLYLPMIKIS